MSPAAFAIGAFGSGVDTVATATAAAPGEGSGGVLQILVGLFVLFLAAKIGDEIARRLGQPGVIGELMAGFIVGPHLIGLVTPGETAEVFAEIGVVILLFGVGLEVRTDDLLAVGRPAVQAAILAMILPIAAGAGLALWIGEEIGPALFVGMALAATSIGVTSKVLADLGVLSKPFARVVLAAAIVDDVLALVLLGLISGVLEGDLSGGTILVAVAAIGLVILGFAVARRVRGLRREAFTWPLFAETPLVVSFILMLATGLVAASIGLAAIVGAFVAGLIVAETEAREELHSEMGSLASIFTPFFFAVTGAQVDLGALADPSLAILTLGLTGLGILTKLVGGAVGAAGLGRWPAIAVGVGLVPRGEVGIVVATLGLSLGYLGGGLFSAVVSAVLLTTVVAPIALGPVVRRAIAGDAGPVPRET